MNDLDIVGLCGSLRSGSINHMALKLAAGSLPAGAAMEIVDWRDIPQFDADDLAAGMPPVVTTLVERLRRADGVVIATPEYNFSIPGAFKNVLDWVSRATDQPFSMKPVAILSASPGPVGGARVQYDLRRVLLFLNAMPLMKPEIFIGGAPAKFDAEGRCTDETTRDFVRQQMAAFTKWVGNVRKMDA